MSECEKPNNDDIWPHAPRLWHVFSQYAELRPYWTNGVRATCLSNRELLCVGGKKLFVQCVIISMLHRINWRFFWLDAYKGRRTRYVGRVLTMLGIK